MFKFTAVSTKPLIIPVFVPHLGCPHRCSFCDQKIITGVECPSPDSIEKTVNEYLGFSKKRERTEISFYGGSFTAIPHQVMMKYIDKGVEFIDKRVVDALRCSTRPDAVSEEIVDVLKKHRFETVELGVQTLSDELLKKMERGHSASDSFAAVNRLKRNGIKTGAQFMTGYPDESNEDFESTLNALKELAPDFIRIYPFVPLVGSLIGKKIKNGEKRMIPVEKIIDRTAEMFHEAMRQNIPVIRIGLPLSEGMPDIYPHNLFQVVVAKAIENLAKNGEREFDIPDEWETSFSMARKRYSDIERK